MNRALIPWVIPVIGLALPVATFADRPPESRDKATHVVVGRIEGVYAQEGATGANQGCLVEIAIEKVERGDGLATGKLLYVSIYRNNPNAPGQKKMTERELKQYLLTVDGGHNPPPGKGTRVRVFLLHSGERYTGIFHDWVEVLK